MRWRSAWAELRHGSLTKEIHDLFHQLKDMTDRYYYQLRRAEEARRLYNIIEENQKKASDEINQKILKDMKEHPEKYIGGTN